MTTKCLAMNPDKKATAATGEPVMLFRLRLGSGKHISTIVNKDRLLSFQQALSAIIRTKIGGKIPNSIPSTQKSKSKGTLGSGKGSKALNK